MMGSGDSPRATSRWMEEVREGMRVYDRNGDEVGKVGQVFFGAQDTDIDEGPGGPAGTASPLETANTLGFDDGLASARGPNDFMPEVLRNRLEKNGFIRVDTGLLASDRYALPDQIATVGGDRVELNVTRDELIKR